MSLTRLGIIGGGQLAGMLVDAASELHLATEIRDISPDSACAGRAGFRQVGSWRQAAEELAQTCEVLTWEREDLPGQELQAQAERLAPSLPVLCRMQDREGQKSLLDELGIASAAWRSADADSDPTAIIDALGLPLMVKARRGGFDGRGQQLCRTPAELAQALQDYHPTGAVVEQLVPFLDEFAVLASRDSAGRVVVYPLVLTHQDQGQLSWAVMPHPRSEELQEWAERVVSEIVEALGHIGTLAVECFRCEDCLLVNEIAPRVHNSGHSSIDCCRVSQFSNHVRAVAGLPVADPEPIAEALLINCIGEMPPAAACGGLARYDYGKKPRPGRKVGHLCLTAADRQSLWRGIAQLPPEIVPQGLLPEADLRGRLTE